MAEYPIHNYGTDPLGKMGLMMMNSSLEWDEKQKIAERAALAEAAKQQSTADRTAISEAAKLGVLPQGSASRLYSPDAAQALESMSDVARKTRDAQQKSQQITDALQSAQIGEKLATSISKILDVGMKVGDNNEKEISKRADMALQTGQPFNMAEARELAAKDAMVILKQAKIPDEYLAIIASGYQNGTVKEAYNTVQKALIDDQKKILYSPEASLADKFQAYRMMEKYVINTDMPTEEKKFILDGAKATHDKLVVDMLKEPPKEKEVAGMSRINEFEELYPSMKGKRGTEQYKNAFLTFTKEYGEARTPSANVYIGQTPEGGVVVGNTRGTPQVSTVAGPGTPIMPKNAPPLPSEQATALQQVQTLKDAVKSVRDNYDPKYVGPVAGRASDALETVAGGYGLPKKQITFNASLEQARNSLVYLLSGKQINETEFQRLNKQLPGRNLAPTAFMARMEDFERTLSSILENKEKQLKASGYILAPQAPRTASDYLKKFSQ